MMSDGFFNICLPPSLGWPVLHTSPPTSTETDGPTHHEVSKEDGPGNVANIWKKHVGKLRFDQIWEWWGTLFSHFFPDLPDSRILESRWSTFRSAMSCRDAQLLAETLVDLAASGGSCWCHWCLKPATSATPTGRHTCWFKPLHSPRCVVPAENVVVSHWTFHLEDFVMISTKMIVFIDTKIRPFGSIGVDNFDELWKDLQRVLGFYIWF